MERRHIGPLREEGIGSAEPLFYRRRLPRGVRLQQASARPPAPRRIRGGMQGKLREVTRETPAPPGPISGRVTPPIRRRQKWRGTGVGESGERTSVDGQDNTTRPEQRLPASAALVGAGKGRRQSPGGKRCRESVRELRDKLYRPDVLHQAWEVVKRNKGTYGVDAQSIEHIEAAGVEEFLSGIAQELKEGTYRATPVRRVLIPKRGKPGTRGLSIPTVKDRVVQTACRLVIEPIFEADFLPASFGFRPKLSAKDASLAIFRWLNFGCVHVVDADIADCFGQIDPERLVRLVERRIADGYVLALIRAWLRAGVMQGDRVFRNAFGVPQGGPMTPPTQWATS